MAKKRSHGEGSVHKLSNGKWQIQIMDGYKPDGTRKYKTFTAPKLEDARKMKLEYEARKAAGMLVAMDYTFSEWADFWFEHHKIGYRLQPKKVTRTPFEISRITMVVGNCRKSKPMTLSSI